METTTWIFTNFQMLLFTETDLHGCLDGYEVMLMQWGMMWRMYTYIMGWFLYGFVCGIKWSFYHAKGILHQEKWLNQHEFKLIPSVNGHSWPLYEFIPAWYRQLLITDSNLRGKHGIWANCDNRYANCDCPGKLEINNIDIYMG